MSVAPCPCHAQDSAGACPVSGAAHANESEQGAAMLFFSGGTAFREVSAELARRGEPTVHLVTPFDSGGSSAELRRAFAMPAVGDIRARLLALAPDTPVARLLGARLPATSAEALAALASLSAGTHPWLSALPARPRRRVCALLGATFAALPPTFDPRRASVGNLVLAALYLGHGRRLNTAACLFGRLVGARGTVRPVADVNAQLCVRLADGRVLAGQRLFTGKEVPPVSAPIADIWLEPATVACRAEVRRRIVSAGLIAYPVGSFYSSLLANLLPRGVAVAVAASAGPKVFIPNLRPDPELLGHSLAEQLELLTARVPVTHVLLDAAWRGYPGGVPARWGARRGLRVVRRPIAQPDGRLDGPATADALLALKRGAFS